jgi:hypothetical protein
MADEPAIFQKGNPNFDPGSGKDFLNPVRTEDGVDRIRTKQLTRPFSSPPGQRRQDDTPVPAQDWRGGHNDSDNRLQRRVSDIQKSQL